MGAGWGPFQAKFGGGPKAQRIEVRVWTPGGAMVNVGQGRLTPGPGRVPWNLAVVSRLKISGSLLSLAG